MLSAAGPAGDDVHRVRLALDEALEAYRLVHFADPADLALLEDFKSNAAKCQPPKGREQRQFLIYGGLSVFKTRAQAMARRQRIVDRLARPGVELRIGDYVARVVLRGPCFAVEDRNEPSGHFTIWGDPFMLVHAVADTYPT
jgi:hypothetical protein